jgi:hypothetical protein
LIGFVGPLRSHRAGSALPRNAARSRPGSVSGRQDQAPASGRPRRPARDGRQRLKRRYFRGDAAFANPEIYGFLEIEAYKYTIRLPTNAALQERIGWRLKRPVGRPPNEVRRYYASFHDQAGSWTRSPRVVVKVE